MQLHTTRHRAYRTSHNLPSGCHTTRRPDIATSQLAVVVTQLCTTHAYTVALTQFSEIVTVRRQVMSSFDSEVAYFVMACCAKLCYNDAELCDGTHFKCAFGFCNGHIWTLHL